MTAVKDLIVPFVRAADEDAAHKSSGHGLQMSGQGPRTALVEHHPPNKLASLFDLDLPKDGRGKDGLLDLVGRTLQFSVNTWDQGFMDKLYASTNAVGVAAEMILATLNTNVSLLLLQNRREGGGRGTRCGRERQKADRDTSGPCISSLACPHHNRETDISRSG